MDPDPQPQLLNLWQLPPQITFSPSVTLASPSSLNGSLASSVKKDLFVVCEVLNAADGTVKTHSDMNFEAVPGWKSGEQMIPFIGNESS